MMAIVVRMGSGAETRGHHLRSHSASGVRRVCNLFGPLKAARSLFIPSRIKFCQEPARGLSKSFKSPFAISVHENDHGRRMRQGVGKRPQEVVKQGQGNE